MINKVVFNRSNPLGYKYPKLPKQIEFKDGINILIGRNGCGKSTVLDVIKFYTLCTPSAFGSSVTQYIKFRILKDGKLKGDADVYGDYDKSTFYLRNIDAEQEGCLKSAKNFVEMYQSKHLSSGEKLMNSLNYLFEYMFSPENIRFPKTDIDVFEKYRGEHHIDGDSYTLILDEPDRNIDIDNLEQVYTILSHRKPNTQVIAAIHNPILIYRLSKLDYVNIIELSKGYLDKIKSFIDK